MLLRLSCIWEHKLKVKSWCSYWLNSITGQCHYTGTESNLESEVSKKQKISKSWKQILKAARWLCAMQSILRQSLRSLEAWAESLLLIDQQILDTNPQSSKINVYNAIDPEAVFEKSWNLSRELALDRSAKLGHKSSKQHRSTQLFSLTTQMRAKMLRDYLSISARN